MYTVIEEIDEADGVGTRQFFDRLQDAERYAESAALALDRDLDLYAGRVMRPGRRRPIASYWPGYGWRRYSSLD